MGSAKKIADVKSLVYFALQSLSVSSVTELHKALAEIHSIRGQMARSVEFRGYGPATLAVTGVLALVAATLQAHWLKGPGREVGAYLVLQSGL
jgi:hypothetical protein